MLYYGSFQPRTQDTPSTPTYTGHAFDPKNTSVNFGALQVKQVCLSFPPFPLFSNPSLA